MPDRFFHYVPNGFVQPWEKLGWVVTPALNDTHHAEYSVLMRWAGEGEPKYPERA
jgi:hypothetical protein